MEHGTDGSDTYRVLVVDDEPTVAELIGLMLTGAGVEVCEAHDGFEAIELARTDRPDVILLDLMMPGLDGIEVCRTLREEENFRSTAIILCSAADQASVEWREAGADDYLQKPFDVSALPGLISDYLES